MLRRALNYFLYANIKVSEWLTPSHVHDASAYSIFDYVCRNELLHQRNRCILDIGAGKRFHFEDLLLERNDLWIIGQDISAEEMLNNHSLSDRFCGDACENIPVDDSSLDLILARATIEHLHDVQSFLKIANRKLKPGGKLIVTFAGKWATFAVLNRIMPQRVKVAILHALVPGSQGVLGFPAHYDNSSFKKFSNAAHAAGFIEELGYSSYYGVGYFRFFVPLFIIAYSIDTIRLFFGLKSLSSYNTFVLVRP